MDAQIDVVLQYLMYEIILVLYNMSTTICQQPFLYDDKKHNTFIYIYIYYQTNLLP